MVNYLFEFSIILNSFPFSIFLNITLALEKLRALQLNAYQLSGILQSLWSSFDRNPNVTRNELNCDFNLMMTRYNCNACIRWHIIITPNFWRSTTSNILMMLCYFIIR